MRLRPAAVGTLCVDARPSQIARLESLDQEVEMIQGLACSVV